jgi:hypothetical protein
MNSPRINEGVEKKDEGISVTSSTSSGFFDGNDSDLKRDSQ